MVLVPDRRFLLLLALPLLACGRSEPLPSEPIDLSELPAWTSSPPHARSVIIAVDGLAATVCGDSFRRPRLAALAAEGCRGLAPGAGGRASAWATLAAGVSPGEHGVFADSQMEFWVTDPSTGRRQWGQGPRRAPNFWLSAGPQASLSVILGVPDDFPSAPGERSRQVVGAGLPGPELVNAPAYVAGLPGGAGLVTLVASATPTVTRVGLPVGEVRLGLDAVSLVAREGRIGQESEGQASVALIPGAWSEPLDLQIAGVGGRRIRAWTRIWTVGLEPLQIVLQPLSADARAPWLPLSHPTSAALELQQRVGRFRTADRAGDRAAMAARALPRHAYDADLVESLEARIDQAVWALERWDAAFVLLALPELAELLPTLTGRERGLDVVEAALSRIAEVAEDAEVTVVSVRGLTPAGLVFDPATLSDAGDGVRFGPHGAVRLSPEVSPARARTVLDQLRMSAEAEPLIVRVERHADWPGQRAGLAPDLRLVTAEGVVVAPDRWSETGGVLLGPLAHPEGPFLADLGPVVMSRLVSD